jgi:hypothetical protein
MLGSSALAHPDRPIVLRHALTRVRSDTGLLYGLGWVLLVSVVSVLLTMQGWRSRIPAFDLLTYIHGVRDLLASGAIPQHGDTGSYGSIKPPGTAWLMVPSALLFDDPRLSEYVGTAILHFLTLLGVFLLARAHLGDATACLAVPLYGLSTHGIFLAGSLWPNGRPDFYVWIVLLCTAWVKHANARLLAAAAAIWAMGMYVDMALAPCCFIPVVLWLLYRPPIRLRPLLVAGVCMLLVWSPYLKYEATRGFADIRSQLLLQGLSVDRAVAVWCEPGLPLRTWEDQSTVATPPAPAPGSLPTLPPLPTIVRGLGDKLGSNFEGATTLPGASIVLAALTLGGLLTLGMSGLQAPRSWQSSTQRRRGRLLVAAVALMVVGPWLLELLIALHAGLGGQQRAGALVLIHRAETICLTAGIAMALCLSLAAVSRALMTRWRMQVRPTDRTRRPDILALCLVVPWLILLVVAEPGKPERFWWLWPIQVVFLAAFVTRALPAFGAPRTLTGAVVVATVALVLSNPMLLRRIEAWHSAGWSGQDADEVKVAAYVGSQLGPDRREAAIGYQVFMYEFMATYNATNPVYKVGADIDVLFTYLLDVENTSRCAEGLSADDEFRIVQTRPKPEAWSPRMFFAASPDGRFRLLQELGAYQVWRR